MGLTRTAITRPVFILMLIFAALLLGFMSYVTMRVEENPDVTFGAIAISVAYPGAGPEEVNNLVARKIEDAVSGINGLKEVTSTSREGFASVTASFELGTDINVALNDVRARVDVVVGDLPRDALKPQVFKFDFSGEPVLSVAFKSDVLSARELRDLLDYKVRDRFAQITGVAAASVSGGETREIQVEVSKDKLLAYGLGINDVQQAISAATVNVPGGRIVTGEQEFSVRLPAEFKQVDDIRNLVFSVRNPNEFGGPATTVRLRDVATITDAAEERTEYSRLDGTDTVVLGIQKVKEGNAIEITKVAKGLLTQVEEQFKGQGLKSEITFEQAKSISESIGDLLFALLFGVFLVALTVYVFLHNFRGTLIVAIAIPICIFVTFIALKLAGFTINNMSMLALSLAVGVLVDDAIVVLENIYRHLRMGEEPRDAAINGRMEIGLAAMAITLVDVVVFLPIAFMGGIVGQFFKPLALGFVFAVLASLFVSFTVTPMLAARWYRKGENVEHPTGRFAHGFERAFGRLEGFYRRVLEWALAHRWFVFISGNLALVAVFMFIGGSFAPDSGSAINGTQMLIMLVIAVSFIVFAANFWPQHLGTKKWRRLLLYLLPGAAILNQFAPKDPNAPPMPAFIQYPMNAITGILMAWVLLGVAAFLVNIWFWIVKHRASRRGTTSRRQPLAKSRLVGNGILFALIFPVAAFAGFAFGQWKGEAVFKFQFMPEMDSGRVAIGVQLPPGSSLAATERVVRGLEEIVLEHPDTKYVLADVGSQSGGFSGGGNTGSTYAQIRVTLREKRAFVDTIAFWVKHEDLRTKSSESVAADMLEMIKRVPGANVTVSASDTGFGAPIQMTLISDDRTKLVETATRIQEGLQSGAVQGVINADVSSRPGRPEIAAIPDRARLADAGLSPAQVGLALRTLYQGNNDAKLREGGREYPIRVMLRRADRDDPDILNQVPVTFDNGTPILLGSVTTLSPRPGVDKIDRRDRQEEVRITADLLPGNAAGTAQAAINKWIDDQKLIPEGVRKKELGQADAQATEGIFLMVALVTGFVLVYMVLASLYDNLLYPAIIQLAQPQAMVGALLALIIADKALNIVGMIGMIALVGLVGKNAILLVDYTNTLRGRGRSRHEALVEAGPTRLRPIMMTTIALVVGTLPVALAIGRGSEFRETIGISIIGGISLSTILTLVVIPCSYTIFDDFSNYLGRNRRRKAERDVEVLERSLEDQAEEREPAAV